MKKLLTTLAVLVLFLGAFAQENESSGVAKRNTVIKFQPLNYALQSYSFEIERMLNGRNAVTLGVGIPNNSSLIGKYGIKASDDLKAAELNTMHIRAAYRHYSGHSGLPRGFYIEPYLKYQSLNSKATITIEEDNNLQALRSAYIAATGSASTFDGNMDAKITTLNAGFQMGTQFLIAKRVAIDFYFLGFEAGLANADLTGTPVPADPAKTADMRDEIQKGIDDLPGFLKNKIKVTEDGNSVKVKGTSLIYPWLRCGINIGIAF